MIERLFFNRFYAVFWRSGVGKKGGGWWNFSVFDNRDGVGFAGSEPGLSKTSFEKANAAVVRWAMHRYNTRPQKR